MQTLQTTRANSSPAPSPETIWAILQENAKEMKESRREFQQEMKQSRRDFEQEMKESRKAFEQRMQETDRQMQETDRRIEETARQIKETDRQIKEYNKRFGEFTNRFGEVVEYMIAPNLREKFRELGYDFPKANPNSNVSDYTNNIHLEVDVMLENGDMALLVEVKTKLTTEHINEHIERLEKMRRYADIRGDKRIFLGAVAGVVMTSDVKDYALKQGLFAIEPSVETFNITPPYNAPKEW
jgi:exonuclease VII large subunit